MPELPSMRPASDPSRERVANGRENPAPRRPPRTPRNQEYQFPSDGGKDPTTILVGGSSRAVVNAVAFAMAELLDLTPFWLEVRDPSSAFEGADPVSVGWIPPERLFISESGRGLESDPALPDRALWSIVRSDEPASVLSHLTDFLKLPELIQEIVASANPAGGAKAMVAANSDRVAHLFPGTAEGLQRFLRTLSDSSLSIVAAHTGPPTPARFGFAKVFRVEGATPEAWMEGTLLCEKGIDHGLLATGRRNRLSDMGNVARILGGLFPRTN